MFWTFFGGGGIRPPPALGRSKKPTPFRVKPQAKPSTTPPNRSYPTSSRIHSGDVRTYNTSGNYARGYSSQTNNWKRNDSRRTNPVPIQTYKSANHNRTSNATNDTTNQGNPFTAQIDSSGTYSTTNNQPFTTSTLWNEPFLSNQTQNTTRLSSIYTAPKISLPRSTDTNNARQNPQWVGIFCHWCYDQKRKHNHSTDKCSFFERATSNEKWNTVTANGLCMWCLQSNHLARVALMGYPTRTDAASATSRTTGSWVVDRPRTPIPNRNIDNQAPGATTTSRGELFSPTLADLLLLVEPVP